MEQKMKSQGAKFLNFVNEDTTNTVNVKEDLKKGWVLFGSNDRYPIEFIKNVNRSPVCTSVVDTLQSFIKGGSLPDEIANIEVNSSGQKFVELHDSICYDIALNLGGYLNVKYNLNSKVTELKNISYEHTRACIPDSQGYINGYKYIPDLYNKQVKNADKIIYTYDTYSPTYAQDQMNKSDLWNGQIKAFKFMRPNSTGQRVYPIPQLNSAASYIEIDYRMGNFHVNAIRNNFHKSHVVVFKGIKPDEKDPEGEYATMRERVEYEWNNMIGDDSAGGSFVQFVNNPNEAIDIKALENSDDDKKYVALDDMVVSKISTASNVPPILANIQTAGKLGDSQEIQNAVSVLNGKTEKYRASLQSFYQDIGRNASGNLEALANMEIPLFQFQLDNGTTNGN